MADSNCHLLIIGAGPGGYVCGIRAGQLGVDTIVVEAEKPGGTCLNVGCIPSKALIHAADEFYKIAHLDESPLGISSAAPTIDFGKTVAWKNRIVKRLNTGVVGLLKKSKTRLVTGTARFLDGKTVEVTGSGGTHAIRAEAIVIATGSKPTELNSLPFGGDVISSTEALNLPEVPVNLAIVGGGYIGLELGTAMAKLGARVTIVEFAEKILPQYDAEITQPVARHLEQLGVEVMTGTAVKGSKAGALLVEGADGTITEIAVDKTLVTVGRIPRTDRVGLDELSLTMKGSFIEIDEKCQTSMRGVYAIGDVTGDPMLAHRAMAQGEMVAELAAGQSRQWDKRCIPAVCFTDPEIVDCGLSPQTAEQAGFEIVTGLFPFTANGRAMTMENESGFVRVLARADNHLVVGVQAVGAGVSELSAAFALSIEMGAQLEDIAGTIHAHPTYSEGLHEACLKALGHALHI